MLFSAVRRRLLELHVAFRVHDQLAVHIAVRIRYVHRLLRDQRHACRELRHGHGNFVSGKHIVVITGHAALHSGQIGTFHCDLHWRRSAHLVAVGVRHRELECVFLVGTGSRKFIVELARRGVQRHRLAVHIERPGLAVFTENACNLVSAVHGKLNRRTFAVVRAEVELHRAVDACTVCAVEILHRQRRHVIYDSHGNGAARSGAVRVRHRHGQIMRDLRVRSRIALVVFRRVAAQFVGKLQLARRRVEARHRQDAFIRGNRVARELTIFKHGHVADDDVGHAVGRIDAQGAFGRGGRLAGGGAVCKAGFIDRQRLGTGFRVTRRHHDVVVHAVDGDGDLARGNVTVRIRVGIGELFRQRLAVRQFLHRRVVVVQPVAVGTVGIQGDRTKMPVLVRIPGKIRTVRAGYRTRERVTDDGDGVPFRHFMREAPDGRYVVHHVHRDGRTVAVAVRIRHRHGQVMGNLRVRSRIAFVVFRGVPVERIAEIQLARDRVIARHGQGAFICGHNVAGQLAVFVNHHVADDDGGHAVGGVDVQGAAGRSGRSGLTRLRTARQAAFIHRQIDRTRFRAGSNGHIVVDIDFWSARLHGIRSKLRAAVETDIQTTQMIDAVQQIAAAVLVIAAAARGTAGGRTGGGHQVFAKGREEVLPADLHTFHLEGRHLFLGIGGVEALQLDGGTILKSQDKIVAIAGQRRRICGKIEDEAPVRSAGDGLCGASSRLGKTDIGHDGPPDKIV